MEDKNDARRIADGMTDQGIPVVVLIACSSRKEPTATIAEDLYIGDLFKLSLEYALKVLGVPKSRIFVLSEKYKLLGITAQATNYNQCLRKMSAQHRRNWATQAVARLRAIYNPLTDYHFEVLAGIPYYENFNKPNFNFNFNAPLTKYGTIGKQLNALKNAIKTNTIL